MDKNPENKDRACENCGMISGPGISVCPNCKGKIFRSLTEAEKLDRTPRVIYRRHPPTDSIDQVKTNILIT